MSERYFKLAVIVVVLALIAGGALWKLRGRSAREHAQPSAEATQNVQSAADSAPAETQASGEPAVHGDQPASKPDEPGKPLPAVIDLGRGMCIACKAMKPILEELAEEYRGRAGIEIIDIGEHPEAARRYGVRLIPTQVFINADGEEVYRHEGFMPREDIVAKLKEMGVG